MCRFLAWTGQPRTLESLVLDPPFGLLRQSYAPRRQKYGTVNADGFGVGWYSPSRPEPARYRTSQPLWSDESFASIAGVIESGCVLAGVRSASVGMPVEVTATAPFTDGRWLFGHNGFVPDASVLRGLLPRGAVPESRVDSALLWAMVSAQLDAGRPAAAAVADIVTAVGEATPGRMNLFLTDGEQLVASAWGDTLWVRETTDGVLVASEPESENDADADADADNEADSTDWHELHDRTLLIVEQGRITTSALGGDPQEGAA
ncbi:MAG: gamma-glutamyl hercynylcysteine S-oxide hydrolase [Frankiaceae bacterium]|nr:gamma-glutamyl hercynylcysteine S-oxide hydrolase [Frankiaceae bacterium]